MKIHIPTPLRAYTDKLETVSVHGATVSEGLDSLTQSFPAMRQHLFTPDGKLRSFVNVYLDDEDVRYLPEKEATPVGTDAELSIIPSIAGGSNSCCPPASGCCR
jgi:molybdopterin synthase sulfur carrier subunit